MVLVISHSGFHPGFKLLDFKNSIVLKDKNKWRELTLLNRLKIALRFKVVHYFWGRTSFLEILIILILGRKVILHFIGSDVLMVTKSKSKQLKTKLFMFLGAEILVVHKNLKNELNEVGIDSKVLEFVNRKIEEYPEIIPKKFSVLVYVPEGKEKFYNLKIIEETAKIFNEIKFHIFPYNSKFLLKNMIAEKPVEHNKVIELINKHKLFVRIPKHDGLPNTMIEALLCARYVVWSFEHPFVYKANSVDELSEVIKEVKKKSELNIEGKKYVLKNYNTETIKQKYKYLWELN